MKTQRLNRFSLTVILGMITLSSGIAQVISVKYDINTLLENNKIEVFNRKVTPFSENDKKGISFSKNENDGIAWLKHVIFSNGSIELDIRGKDEYQQSFVGLAFHGLDNNTYDIIYFRPFNFQAADSVRRIHAVQYVSLPDYTWQVLREQFNGKYEKAVSPAPNANDWFHVKINIKFPLVKVFVNGNHEPCLIVEKLNTRSSGKMGLWVGNNSDGDFANLEIMSLDN